MIYIILVNWNGAVDTIECLESLLRLDDGGFKVVVVDNGSADNSVGQIDEWSKSAKFTKGSEEVWGGLPAERRHPLSLDFVDIDEVSLGIAPKALVTVVLARTNLGFAGANNVGLRLASADARADFFWILNNDTVVAPDSLTRLKRYCASNPEDYIVGAVLRFYNNPQFVQGLGGWLSPWRALSGHIGSGLSIEKIPSAEEVQRKLSYVMGASMFVARDFYLRVGGMSERYFLYYEELDWAKQLPEGTRQSVCLDAFVFHKEGATIGTSSTSRPSDTSLYYGNASTLKYYWAHEKLALPIAILRIARNIVSYTIQGDWMAIRVVVRAVSDVIVGKRRRGAYGTAEFAA